MENDYRVSDFCPAFDAIPQKKVNLVKLIREKHPRAQDLYALISPNDSEYKIPFMEMYNFKCAYCGVSIDIIPKDNFEIDHYIHKENKEKFKSIAEAGCIGNLVLACKRCNRNKHNHAVPDDHLAVLNPNLENIKSVFNRTPDYYIDISEKYRDSEPILKFYQKLKLGEEIHRLDYLLMQLLGKQQHTEDPNAYRILGESITCLRKKRNLL